MSAHTAADLSSSVRDAMDIAEKKVRLEGWQSYSWEMVDGGDSIIKGCTPSGIFKSGPRKGKPKFKPAKPGTERTVIVTRAEVLAEAAAYESTTGKCWNCKGTGQTFWSWSKADGTKTRPCERCGGTGSRAAIQKATGTEVSGE